MAAGRKITVEFLGNDKTLGSTADQVEGKFGKLGGRLKKFGAVAATGFAAAGVGAVAAGTYFFQTGARLEQMAAKADAVFGSSLGSVEKWADESAHKMGLTRREATGLAANFADLLIPMGFTRKEAAKMSTDVVGLSGALSQWSGGTKSAAEVTEILNAAMLGETDGLKALGISISAAEVDAQLLKKGQDKLTGSAKQQAEAQAIQSLIFAKSTDAQKAFAEGGSPLLSAQAKLKAIFGEVRDEIAVRLLPVMSRIADWAVNTGLPALQRLGGWIRSDLMPIFRRIGAVVRQVMGTLRGDVDGNLGAVKQAVNDFVSIVRSLWRKFGADIIRYTKSTFDNVRQVIKGVLNIIGGILKVFSAVLKGDWRKAWEGVKQILRGAGQALGGIVRQIFNLIGSLARVGGRALVGIVRGIPGMLRGLGGAFLSAGGFLIGRFIAGLKKVGSVIADISGDIWGGIKSAFNSVVGGINAAIPNQVGKGPLSIDLPDNPFPSFAKGTTSAPGGWSWVGEQGPELVNLRRGAQVIPNGRSMAAAGGAGSPVVVQLKIGAKVIEQILIDHVRTEGRPLQVRTLGPA